jgi:hypothetical protein
MEKQVPRQGPRTSPYLQDYQPNYKLTLPNSPGSKFKFSNKMSLFLI